MSRASSRRSSQNGAVTSRRGDKKATARKLVAGEREELDGFDGYEPLIPPDIPSGEHEALLEIWRTLGGRRWRRGEQWRYSDACEWEGVTVRGGEFLAHINEEHLRKYTKPTPVADAGSSGLASDEAIKGPEEAAVSASASSPTKPPSRSRGVPQFKVGERVWIQARLREDGGLAGWCEGDAMRLARVEVEALKGQGVHQIVEYNVRFLDGHVVAIDLSENHLVGALPVGLLPRLPYLEAFRVHGNECYGTIDVELLRAKCRGLLEVRFGAQDSSAGFELPSNLAVVVEPYSRRATTTSRIRDELMGDGRISQGMSNLAVNDALQLAMNPAAAMDQASNETPAEDFNNDNDDDDDGGLAWLAENPVGQRDPRDSGDEENGGDDPEEDWIVRTASVPECKQPLDLDTAAAAAAATTPSLEVQSSSTALPPLRQLDELKSSLTDIVPVEASSLALVDSQEGVRASSDGGSDGAANQLSKAAWEGPEYAWPLPGDTTSEAAQKLTTVDLSRCSLRGVLYQSPLSQLGTTLTTLVLDGNALEGPLAGACTSQLVQLTALEHLSLSQNLLSGPLPSELCKLHKTLRVLNLGSNRLLGPIPAEWVYFEDKLEELSLFDNAGVDSLRDSWLADRLPLCLVHL